MQINSSDIRRVHTCVVIRNGERQEEVVWGDIRQVSIGLKPGEVPDMLSSGYRDSGKLFRPERADMQWQRNTYWGRSGASHGWKYPMSESRKLSADRWLLTNARIAGTNIRADGSLGKLNECVLYANDEGYGVSRPAEQPDWYAKIFAEYDPNITGSPLDGEPTP